MPTYGEQQPELKVREQQNKNISGAKTNEFVGSMLNELASNEHFNISVKKRYAQGYPNMVKQFKMDYCVVFHDFDDAKWLIKTTNTIRDRIYSTEFFAQNIRIIDEETNEIERIFVVVPDSVSEKEQAGVRRYSDKIKGNTYKSFLSDVITINELRDRIIEKCMVETSQGIRSNIIGTDAEKRVVQLLKDKRNWQLWNDFESCKHDVKTDTFLWFKAILTGIGKVSSDGQAKAKDIIQKIEAVDRIPKLRDGGSPKTDVSFQITTQSTEKEMYNISIKRTEKKQVSVHEGNVLDLIAALNIKKNPLATALMAFQKHGSIKGLQENQGADYVDILTKELPKYNRELVEFALFGVNNPRITHPIQEANCILYFDSKPEKDCFWLREAYVKHYLENFVSKGQFGTPFQWTYPSGKRGSSFQLKGFTNN